MRATVANGGTAFYGRPSARVYGAGGGRASGGGGDVASFTGFGSGGV